MAFVVYIVDDIVKEREVDNNQAIKDLPSALEGKADSDLRWKESSSAIVDATLETDFFIDDDGVKHLQNYAADVVEVSGTFTLNRRAAGDRVERSSGSFVTDGFTAGSWLTISGSVSNDGIYLIDSVTADYIYTDRDVKRISPDENNVAVTLHQGWQLLEGINFSDELRKTSNNVWAVKTAAQIKTDTFNAFDAELTDIVNQHVIEQTPYPERHRNNPEGTYARAKIVRSATSFTGDDADNDIVLWGGDIYGQTAAQTTGVDITFDATNDRITRASGSFITDGWKRVMNCRPTGSSSNNKVFTVKSVEALHLNISNADKDKLVDEGPSSGITLDGLSEITGYENWRSDDNPGEVGKLIWRRWMQEGVAQNWFDDVADKERDWRKDANNAADWAVSTVYALDDVVYDNKKYYICTTAHTSGTGTIQDDIANWSEYTASGITLPNYPTVQIAS